MMTRRDWLTTSSLGFGGIALQSLLADSTKTPFHHKPTAKAVILLYMDGGPSQIDSFDYKPKLEKFHGQDPHKVLDKVEPTQFANVGKVLKSPWKFQQHGKSGAWVSELFPKIAECADDLAFVKSMTSKSSEHTNANYFLHTGSTQQGRPSWGAWAGYGLGHSSKNLPSYVVLNGGLIPPGGLDNFTNAFLPATYQGSIFKSGNLPLANVVPVESKDRQLAKLELLKKLEEHQSQKYDAIESAIGNYETAFQMQTSVPDLMDLSKETKETQNLYGLDNAFRPLATYARQCLIARRLVERGVKLIEITCAGVGGADRWDQHSGLVDGHVRNAMMVDQPIAALLKDLKSRGMLKDTLVIWAGEFGRTPFAQGSDGRDHNPYGFTVWFAGGGAKPGVTHGATDDWGYKVVEGKCEMHDFHATLLHFLGFDHKKLTYRFGGRDMRLTDVHGELIKPIIG